MLIFQKVFAPSTTNFLPQSFGKRGVFVHSWRVNWEGKLVKGEGSWEKNYGFGLAGKHGYITGRSTTSAVQCSVVFAATQGGRTGQEVFKNSI